MFKADWESTNLIHQLPEELIKQMVLVAYPNKKLISHELIASGCANLNFKILLQHESNPLILRIYLRDKNAVYREQKLTILLKKTIPVPLTLYIGELNDYNFAITEFMPGIPLRELLLSNVPVNELEAIMFDIGTILSKITAYEFEKSGFFDKELNIIPNSSSDDYIAFTKDCLKSENILSMFTPEVIYKINYIIKKNIHLFPNNNEKHLIHADFDPANILVCKSDNIWKVSGVLDWEFAFSGSTLWDVATMLRYAHKMPFAFKDEFLNGLSSCNTILPKNWNITVNLLNLLSLLDCLKRTDLKKCPNRCADIFALIDHILSQLDLNCS